MSHNFRKDCSLYEHRPRSKFDTSPLTARLLTLQIHLELRPHQAKAWDPLFQGNSQRWIQTKSVLALLGQNALLEAAQNLEGTLVKERLHIKIVGSASVSVVGSASVSVVGSASGSVVGSA